MSSKLITLVSFIVIVSLGSITALVYRQVHADLRVAAWENNLETNRLSAMEAESTLTSIRSNSRILIQTITALGLRRGPLQKSVDFFFAENPQIAAVFFAVPGAGEQLFVNSRFFSLQNINETFAAPFFNAHKTELERAVRGETLVKNAAPYFSRPVLALFFPWENGGAGGVIFSFDFEASQSYMINTDGDILSHADFSFAMEGTNIADLDFIRSILDGFEDNGQMLLESDFGVSREASHTRVFEKVKPVIQPLLDRLSEALAITGIGFKESGEDVKVMRFAAFTKLNTAGVVVITSVEYDKVFEGIKAATRRNICLAIAILFVSIIIVLLFSRSISIPLKALAAAAQQIENGNFEPELPSKNRGEIGALTSGFQKMCSALHVFGRFTNKKIAVKAMQDEIKPGGLPKHATVFFSGIHNFAATLENFNGFFGHEASGKIVNWLNSYFTQIIQCVEKTNGVVDKFIGDEVMAHWGAAYTAGNPRIDAFNCIKAALMMRKALYFLNKERKKEDPATPAIRIGCGINSGIVTAGQFGSDIRMEYTVIGDPVNLASRIETFAKHLGADILISESTWRLIGEKFVTEEMPSIKHVRIFAVINFYGESKGPQNMDEVRSLLGIEPPNFDDAFNS